MDAAAEELRALKTELQSMKTQCVHCVCAHTHIPTHTLSFLRGSVCVCVSACVRVCVCVCLPVRGGLFTPNCVLLSCGDGRQKDSSKEATKEKKSAQAAQRSAKQMKSAWRHGVVVALLAFLLCCCSFCVCDSTALHPPFQWPTTFLASPRPSLVWLAQSCWMT